LVTGGANVRYRRHMLKWGNVDKLGSRTPGDRASAPASLVHDWILETAIAREQVDVLFQPLIAPRTGRVIGAEALARSPMAPCADDLFARAVAGGLEERLSRLVQRKALRAAALWEGPLRALRLSINLLPQEICRAGFDQWLLDEIGAVGIDPRRVTVEITENALLVDQSAVAARLTRLRDAGISIAVDDFGTGYASMAYLTALPLDMIKIDRGLIAGLVGGERDRIVVRAMIRLARELDLKVVIEGVESTAQLALLAEWGCDLYQGFIGAGALTQDELTRFVATAEIQAA
jgi:EAL domain-containing protein (putative c-di-GMP-specific phosphodiesterase class I)